MGGEIACRDHPPNQLLAIRSCFPEAPPQILAHGGQPGASLGIFRVQNGGSLLGPCPPASTLSWPLLQLRAAALVLRRHGGQGGQCAGLPVPPPPARPPPWGAGTESWEPRGSGSLPWTGRRTQTQEQGRPPHAPGASGLATTVPGSSATRCC